MSILFKKFLFGVAFTSSILFAPIYSCGDILIRATDNTIINARSMEFGLPLDTTLAVKAKGSEFQSSAPNNGKGISWTSKYGYVGFMALGIDFPTDGLNEKGLSFGALWLPTSVFQEVTSGNAGQALLLNDFGSWILGNFETVEEVKAALPSVYVWGAVVEQIGMIPPVHFSIHDASGNSIVIEFRDGQQKVYDNPLAVLTNYPTFPWHVDNLRNYIKLSPDNAQPLKYDGATLSFYGQGNGLLGIPGDYMPSSRFVRLAYLKNFSTPAKNGPELLSLAQHIFNNVDIGIGFIREGDDKVTDYTQFVTFKDLTNKVIFYRTYGNMTLRSVNLKNLDFSPGKKYKQIPLEIPATVIDVTKDFVAQAAIPKGQATQQLAQPVQSQVMQPQSEAPVEPGSIQSGK